MNIKEIIESGLIEQYVLGLTSPEENRQIEQWAEAHPEFRKELVNVQKCMEDYAQANAVIPPPGLKNKIGQRIDEIETACLKRNFKNQINKIRALAVVATLLAIALGAYSFFLSQENKDAQLNLASAEKDLKTCLQDQQYAQTIAKENKVIVQQLSLLKDSNTRHIHLRGNNPNALTVVYWNDEKKEARLQILDLPKPASDQQYQLWADIEGVMVDMGVLDYKNSSTQLVNIPFMVKAESLNITLEPKGGSDHPNVAQLKVSGKV